MKTLLNSRDGKLYLGDEPFYLISGDVHYFRIHPSQWEERLKLMADFGLTAIQTYCPWNLHEPKRGEYNFEGILDFEKFIKIAEKLGMKVLLRPAPFICSECDFGGMPSWLAKDRDITLRSLDERYIEALDEYYSVICKRIVPLLSTNGGPVIAVALENEFGGVSLDTPYLEKIAEILTKYGVDVPYYTTDGNIRIWQYNGTIDGTIMEGLNFRSQLGEGTKAFQKHNQVYPDKPFFVGELWAGRAIYWGDPYHPRNPQETVDSFKECLETGGYVNFYMFSGGTNFGFFSGAIEGKSYSPRPNTPSRYIAHTTSYDDDALISEYGVPTAKYYLCRDVLDDYLGRPRRERTPYEYKAQKVLNIQLNEAAYMLDNADALTEIEVDSVSPKYMEDIGQDYGFILYSKQVPSYGETLDTNLKLYGVRDRATVYVDGEYVGMNMRDRECDPIPFKMPVEGVKLDVLVENVARINTGIRLTYERKGILEQIRYNDTRLVGWKNRALTLRDISGLDYQPITDEIKNDMPVFLKGIFDAKAGVDSFVHTAGFTRGYVWVNGFNLGRYWDIGPQMTLYIPGALLKDKDNVIEILDINPKNNPRKVDLIDRQLLEMD